jgi:hypothetical protein
MYKLRLAEYTPDPQLAGTGPVSFVVAANFPSAVIGRAEVGLARWLDKKSTK